LKQPFADLRTIMSAEELIDLAFSRASKPEVAIPKRVPTLLKVKRKEIARITTVKQVLMDRLMKPVNEVPRVEEIHPFYRELADVLVGVGGLKKSLGALKWAAKMVSDLADHYTRVTRRAGTITEAAKARREAYGRIASIVRQISSEIEFLREARKKLEDIPSIDPEMITIVVAGYANVGKSTFVKGISTAKPEVAVYPFTTKEIIVGHRDAASGRCQVIDTPGLLDRPLSERNKIELQAIIALKYLADVIVFMADPSETCGYKFSNQLNLYQEILDRFKGIPILKVLNKVDLADPAKIEEAKRSLGSDTFEAISTQKIGTEEIFEEALKIVAKKENPA